MSEFKPLMLVTEIPCLIDSISHSRQFLCVLILNSITVCNIQFMNKPLSFYEQKNELNKARWAMRKALTCGQSLQDLRTVEQQKAWWKLRKAAWKMKKWAIEANDDLKLKQGVRV